MLEIHLVHSEPECADRSRSFYWITLLLKFEWHEKIKIYRDSDHQDSEGKRNGYQSKGLMLQV